MVQVSAINNNMQVSKLNSQPSFKGVEAEYVSENDNKSKMIDMGVKVGLAIAAAVGIGYAIKNGKAAKLASEWQTKADDLTKKADDLTKKVTDLTEQLDVANAQKDELRETIVNSRVKQVIEENTVPARNTNPDIYESLRANNMPEGESAKIRQSMEEAAQKMKKALTENGVDIPEGAILESGMKPNVVNLKDLDGKVLSQYTFKLNGDDVSKEISEVAYFNYDSKTNKLTSKHIVDTEGKMLEENLYEYKDGVLSKILEAKYDKSANLKENIIDVEDLNDKELKELLGY